MIGACVPTGSCWAFAAAGSLEALIAIVRNDNITYDLSEAQLVDCMPTAYVGCTEAANGSEECDGCQGGDPSIALSYALYEWDGLANETAYPYGSLITASEAGTCKVGACWPTAVQAAPGTCMYSKTVLVSVQSSLVTFGLVTWLYVVGAKLFLWVVCRQACFMSSDTTVRLLCLTKLHVGAMLSSCSNA